MHWLDYFMPDEVLSSVYDVTPETCRARGVLAVVFDIDNTLVPYDTPLPDERLKSHLLSFPAAGIAAALVSNNDPERVETFNRDLHFTALAKAGKPGKKSLAPILTHFSPLAGRQILLVGDQLLTDVLAARKNGLSAVVVPPIKKKESAFFRFKRWLEVPLMRRYFRKKAKKTTQEEERKETV